jgi:uncharacterized protein
VTGASTGILFDLAKRCAKEGYDLLIAADEAAIEQAATSLRKAGAQVEAIQADLATTEGVDKRGGQGPHRGCASSERWTWLGRAFLDQDFDKARRVIDTNVAGTVYLIHKIGNDMRRKNTGRILITGSIAGSCPGVFRLSTTAPRLSSISFSFALREKLKDTKVTVTCLMPGATETEFFKRAEMMDIAIGTMERRRRRSRQEWLRSHDERRRRRRQRPQEQGPICGSQCDASRRPG